MPDTTPSETGFAPVNGLQLYYESVGQGSPPLILLHGGFGSTATMSHLPPRLGVRRVISVDQCRVPLLPAHPAVRGPRRRRTHPEEFPQLMDKMGDLLRREYDWSGEVGDLTMPLLLVGGGADSFPVSALAEFFALLGGSQGDSGWDGSGPTTSSRLAVLPGATHHDILGSAGLPGVVTAFLDG